MRHGSWTSSMETVNELAESNQPHSRRSSNMSLKTLRAWTSPNLGANTAVQPTDFLVDMFGEFKAGQLNLRTLEHNNLHFSKYIFDQVGDILPGVFFIRFHSIGGKTLDTSRILCSTFTFIYAFFAISFRGIYTGLYSTGVIVECVVNFLFFLTQLLLFRRSHFDVHLSCERLDLRYIRAHLLSSKTFYYELASCLPIASIYLHLLCQPTKLSNTCFQGHPALDIFVCFAYLAPRILIMNESPPGFMMSQFNTRVSIARLFITVILTGHMFACGWHLARWYSGSAFDALARTIPNEEDRTLLSWYLASFRDGIFLISVQDRHATTNGELLALIIIGPIAAFFFAYVFGNTTVILQRALALHSRHYSNMSYINSAMNCLRLPTDLQFRITMYHQYVHLHHNTSAYSALFNDISDNLLVEVRLFLFSGLFGKTDFFAEAGSNFLKEMVLHLQESVVSPGDNVVVEGDSMYFILKGESQILDKDGDSVATLMTGNHFGEIAIVFGSKRLATVRAVSYCVLGGLFRTDFESILEHFPDERQRIVSVANSRSGACNSNQTLDELSTITTTAKDLISARKESTVSTRGDEIRNSYRKRAMTATESMQLGD